MTGKGKITHVSDTASWVACYRALETERPDAIFKDPYARRLAGERGLRDPRRHAAGPAPCPGPSSPAPR